MRPGRLERVIDSEDGSALQWPSKLFVFGSSSTETNNPRSTYLRPQVLEMRPRSMIHHGFLRP